MRYIYLWIAVLVLNALFYVCFPDLPATGNRFMFFTAVACCALVFGLTALIQVFASWGRHAGKVVTLFYFAAIACFLGFLMPQSDRISPFKKLQNGNVPTSTTMKRGYEQLKDAIFFLNNKTTSAIKNSNISIDAIEKAAN